MIGSRHENRKRFAPASLKIPPLKHRCNKVAQSAQYWKVLQRDDAAPEHNSVDERVAMMRAAMAGHLGSA